MTLTIISNGVRNDSFVISLQNTLAQDSSSTAISLIVMATTAQGKAAKAIKAVGDTKTKDALYAIVTMIGNVQHESVKAMAQSLDRLATEKMTHLSVDVLNRLERHKEFVESNNKIQEERMTLAMSEIETKFYNHAMLIRTVQARSEKLVELMESIDVEIRTIKKNVSPQTGQETMPVMEKEETPYPLPTNTLMGQATSLDNRIGNMQSCYKKMETRNRGRSPSPSGHGLFHQTGEMTELAMAAAQVIARHRRRPESADSHATD
jgi:hypothetical protein